MIKIREARKEDVLQMVGLLNELFSMEKDFAPDASKQEKGLNLLGEQKESGFILVAEANEKIVGMCSLQYLISTAEGSSVGLIEDMVVTQEYRAMGIGKKLLDAAFSLAKEKGCQRIQLLADRENVPALQFYNKIGFVETQLVALRIKNF